MIYLTIFSLFFGYIYEDNDSLIVQNDSLVICGDHQYNIKIHISNAGKLKVTRWSAAADSFGILGVMGLAVVVLAVLAAAQAAAALMVATAVPAVIPTQEREGVPMVMHKTH
jgi:hypothetical protein